MLFDAFEISRFLGRPVRLYEFIYQNEVWRFAQANTLITTPGDVDWHPAQIERDNIRLTAERAKDKLGIRMACLRDPSAPEDAIPVTQPIGDLWHPYIPCAEVRVNCYEWHVGAEDAPIQVWTGYAKQAKYNDVQIELTCMPGNAHTLSRGQGPKQQPGCWKVPYSTGVDGCNLDPDAFEVAATLSAVDGLDLTAAAFASAPHSLLQGEWQWERDVTRQDGTSTTRLERRTIIAHSGDTIRIQYGGVGLAAALEGVALPSCPGTHAACVARSNTINFGGSAYQPVKDPMKGQSMSWG